MEAHFDILILAKAKRTSRATRSPVSICQIILEVEDEGRGIEA
jgi:hypothetical protein